MFPLKHLTITFIVNQGFARPLKKKKKAEEHFWNQKCVCCPLTGEMHENKDTVCNEIDKT